MSVRQAEEENMSKRATERAIEWAKEIIKSHKVAPEDQQSIQNVLQELVLFEDPMPNLSVGISKISPGVYVLTVTGYTRVMSDKTWASIFLSEKKAAALHDVVETTTTLTLDGIIKTIYVGGSIDRLEEIIHAKRSDHDILDLRDRASRWASGMVRTNHANVIKNADLSHIDATLQELLLFEVPLPELSVGIRHSASEKCYVITVQGYKHVISDTRWVQTFLGDERSIFLANVTDTKTVQSREGPIKVIHVSEIEMQSATPTTGRKALQRRFH